MTDARGIRWAGAWVCALLLAAFAAADEPTPAANGGEPIVLESGPIFEEIQPPAIDYEEYAGPDPVLEGTPPPRSRPATAGEQRIAELWQEETATGQVLEGEGRPEFGARSVAGVVVALCVVLGLIVVSLVLIRRFGAGTPLLAGANLGQVLGRVYLSPKASLHFVRTGGKVLVVGVTQESVQLVETFDASAFEKLPELDESAEAANESAGATAKGNAFLAQLREQSTRINQPAEPAFSPGVDGDGDGDIANLRGDIERLQRMLREATRE